MGYGRFLFLLGFFLIFSIGFGSAALEDNLTAYFDLNGNLIDRVAGNHNGVNHGATAGVPGIIGTAYSFDGVNDFVDLIPSTRVCEDDNICSISMWVKFSSNSYSSIWYQGTTSHAYGNIRLSVNSGGLALEVRDFQGILETLPIPTSISDNQWHHVVIAGAGNQFSVYLDGALSAQGNFSILPQGSTNIGRDENFGRQTQGDYWEGQLDEVGIWNRTLTSAEVTLLYHSGFGITYPLLTQMSFEPIANQIVNEGENLTIQLEAESPFGSSANMVFGTDAGSVLPSAFSLNTTSGLFEWTPGFEDSGFYNVTFSVTDGVESLSQTVVIEVVDVTSVNDLLIMINALELRVTDLENQLTGAGNLTLTNLSERVDNLEGGVEDLEDEVSGLGTLLSDFISAINDFIANLPRGLGTGWVGFP